MTTFYVLMPRWPLSLPPPAAPTLPSRSHPSSLSIAVKFPSRRHLPSSCRDTVHRHRGAIAPSIAFAPPCPLLSSCCHAVHCRSLPSSPLPLRCRCFVHCRSIAIELLPLHCPLLSLPLSHPSPLNCCCTVHRPLLASVHCHCAVNCCQAVHCRQAVH
jgi:hypothetical protein